MNSDALLNNTNPNNSETIPKKENSSHLMNHNMMDFKEVKKVNDTHYLNIKNTLNMQVVDDTDELQLPQSLRGGMITDKK